MGNIKVHPMGDYNRGYVTLNERGNEADGIVLYSMLDDTHCGIYYVEAEQKHEKEQYEMIQAACDDIRASKKIPVPSCKEAQAWFDMKKMMEEQDSEEDTRIAVR